MKRILTALTLMPSAALAHSGDHSHVGPAHMLSAPDHFISLMLLVAVAAMIGWLVARR